jgi:hypothetical protein
MKVKRKRNNFTKIIDRDWKQIQSRYDEGVRFPVLVKEFHITFGTLKRAVETGLLVKRNEKFKHSEEHKQKMSIFRKQFLKDNPDKCHWRSLNKFKSKPCENVKEFLQNLNILFVEEYQPEIEGRFFSLDIALPEKMIALEINGGQHYLPDGSLKPYYQERHDLLVANGWNVFEIHYSACYNLSKWAEFTNTLKEGEIVKNFDYFTYKPREKKCAWKNKCSCGGDKANQAKVCRKCRSYQIIKGQPWGTRENLFNLVWEKSLVSIGKQFDLSANAIKKHCIKLNIPRPKLGHWERSKEKRVSKPSLPPLP